MQISIIKEASQRVSTWSGGETKEIYIYPEQSSYLKRDFSFRISSATIDIEKSKFTRLQGINRFITTLNNEINLIHNHGEKIKLSPYEIHEFKGSINTESIGVAKDFNLMVKEEISAIMKCIDIQKGITEEEVDLGENVIYSPISEIYVYINSEEYLLSKGDAMIIKNHENVSIMGIKSKDLYENKAIICKVQV